MSEIKKPLIKLVEGSVYTAGAEDYVITDDHTISDIIRFIYAECGNDISELKYLVDNFDQPE
jgi:pyoverdine/dityrosine biosynthesis protein Dit1